MKREPHLRWYPTPHESLNRYTMEVLHEAALKENQIRTENVKET